MAAQRCIRDLNPAPERITCCLILKALSILIADDEADIRLLMEIWLKETGHTVVSVAEGAAARACLGQKPFDLVVTDVLMPKTDGLGLIAEIKKMQPSARIVAISGGGRYVDGTDCLKMATGLGAHAAVIKPFKREQLLAAIREAFAPLPRPTAW